MIIRYDYHVINFGNYKCVARGAVRVLSFKIPILHDKNM